MTRHVFALGAVLFVMTQCRQTSAEKSALQGCGNIKAISAALDRLEKDSWNDLSLDRIQKLWPTHLQPFDCNGKACRSLLYQGRIIDNTLQCGEKIDLDTKPDSAAGTNKSLAVTVAFSDPDKEKVISAARMLAKAAGVSTGELDTVGREEHQRYSARKEETEFLNAEFSFTRIGTLWTLSAHFYRILVAPHKP